MFGTNRKELKNEAEKKNIEEFVKEVNELFAKYQLRLVPILRMDQRSIVADFTIEKFTPLDGKEAKE